MPEPVRADAKPPEILVVPPVPQKAEASQVEPAVAKVVFEGLDDDVPSDEDVQSALEEEKPAEPVFVPRPEPIAPRALLFDEESQTRVEPVSRSVPIPARKTEKRKPVYQPAEDPIFAAYGGRSWPAVNVNYRSVLLVVGFLTMGVVFFVGRVVMSDSFAGQGPVKKVEAETVSSQLPPAQAPQQTAVPASREPDQKSFDISTSDGDLDASQLKPLTTDEKASPPRQMFYPTPTIRSVGRDETAKAAAVAPTAQSQPSNTTVSQNTAKPLPFAPSVVIPYKGRPKEKVQNEKDCADQQAPADQNRTSPNRAMNITRPRIVRDPKN
jgi:hypothetical protein